jgi:hypothetical protein
MAYRSTPEMVITPTNTYFIKGVRFCVIQYTLDKEPLVPRSSMQRHLLELLYSIPGFRDKGAFLIEVLLVVLIDHWLLLGNVLELVHVLLLLLLNIFLLHVVYFYWFFTPLIYRDVWRNIYLLDFLNYWILRRLILLCLHLLWRCFNLFV